MSDPKLSRRVATLLTIAAEDLAVARTILPTSRRVAFYQLSQAAEKIARAVVEAAGHRLRPSHQLAFYTGQLPANDPWRLRLLALDPLSHASTAARYPGEQGEMPRIPGVEVLQDWAAKLEQLLAEVVAEMQRRFS